MDEMKRAQGRFRETEPELGSAMSLEGSVLNTEHKLREEVVS